MADAPGAGWHPDPRGRHEHRYWDGTRWTDHVADGGRLSTDPVNALTPVEPAPVARTEASPESEPEVRPVPTRVQSRASARRDERPTWVWAGPEPPAEEEEPQPEPEPAGPTDGPEPEAGSPAAPSRELGVLLSVVAPGSGHLYLGAEGPKRTTAVALLAATLVAVALADLSFGLWLMGLLIWLAAAAYAVVDLDGSAAAVGGARLGRRLTGLVLAVAGGALVVSLLLPWYHVSIAARGVGAAGGNASGFESLGVVDLVLVLVGAAALASGVSALGRAAAEGARRPPATPLVAAGGGLAVLLVFYRMLVDTVPDFGVSGAVHLSVGRAPGILLAGAASLAICLAAAGALRSSAGSTPAA